MNIHHNARLTFRGRELLVKRIVEQGLRVEAAAQASGVSVRTAYKWLRLYRQEGITGSLRSFVKTSSLSSSDLGSSSSGDCAAEASPANLPADQSAARCLSKHRRAGPTEVGTESVFGT